MPKGKFKLRRKRGVFDGAKIRIPEDTFLDKERNLGGFGMLERRMKPKTLFPKKHINYLY